MGWFKNGLHGFGKEIRLLDERRTSYEGHFLKGIRKNTDEIDETKDDGYNVETAFNAQKIIWS